MMTHALKISHFFLLDVLSPLNNEEEGRHNKKKKKNFYKNCVNQHNIYVIRIFLTFLDTRHYLIGHLFGV